MCDMKATDKDTGIKHCQMVGGTHGDATLNGILNL
jgi:hypothetical protein